MLPVTGEKGLGRNPLRGSLLHGGWAWLHHLVRAHQGLDGKPCNSFHVCTLPGGATGQRLMVHYPIKLNGKAQRGSERNATE